MLLHSDGLQMWPTLIQVVHLPQVYLRYVLQHLIDVLQMFFGVLPDVSLNEVVLFVRTVKSTVTTVYIVNKVEGFSNGHITVRSTV